METEPAIGRRQRQGMETKARIYDTAWRLIGEEGFDQVSVDRICARAGVAKGSFYHHFHTKADLIVEGYSLCDKYFEEEVAGHFAAEEAGARIVEFVEKQVLYAVDVGLDLMRQVYKSQLENGTSFFISAERSLPTILRGIVVAGQARGELTSEFPPEYIVDYVLRFSRGMIYDWCLHSGTYDIVAVAAEACGRLVAIFRAHGE
jgi:TetR/AcrR family transcriptional regulator, fatty acid metabolism regulator protein